MDETDTDELDREAQLERLPARSPLSNTLTNLFAAKDRESFARGHDELDYEKGAVRVSITLKSKSETPEQYFKSETTGHADMVIGEVDVDDLVDLALDDSVKSVQLPPQPYTHDD